MGQAGAGGDAEGVGGEELAAGGEKPGGPVAFVCGVSALLGSRERFVVVVGGWGGARAYQMLSLCRRERRGET